MNGPLNVIMDPREDLYAVLGIPRGADAAAIKSAYRRLSMELHPDRNPGDATAGNKFARIGQAFEVLGNPETRRQYDEGRLAQTVSHVVCLEYQKRFCQRCLEVGWEFLLMLSEAGRV